jgi:hypothetical protein
MHNVLGVLVEGERANETDVVLFGGQTVLYAFTVTETIARWLAHWHRFPLYEQDQDYTGWRRARETVRRYYSERRVLDRIHQRPPQTASRLLAIHINKTGRVCFGKDAAARLGEAKYLSVAIDGETIRLDTLDNVQEGALTVRDANGRPYVSAACQLKQFGFDGSRSYNIEAKPYGKAGFEFELA